ncbi:MAG TPA: methylenetetrahydrofolate reductase [NAD(P)H] [Kineosporiaceae bacterium]|nr:methylenetetrahydrofolate reductase [NAD(P)H] [Kineosporiaceae bacterium]
MAAADSSLRSRLAAGRSFSFEFFPPRDDAGEALLWEAVRRLESFSPSFVSVTYGAGGSTRDRTTRITAAIAESTTLTPVAHLTCVGASRADLRQVIGAYAAAGVGTVLALRGDPPGGPGAPWTPHPEGLDHAVDLVRLIRRLGSFEVAVAAFPDVHPESPDLDHDARVLAAKADAGAGFAITQFLFEPEGYFRLVDRVAARGCEIPIIPGIMPVTNLRQIERFPQLSGKPLPRRVLERLQSAAAEPAALRRAGVEIATELSSRLLDGGAPGLHFYTLNRSTATLEVFADLGLVTRPPA